VIQQIQECIDYFKYICLNDIDATCWVAGGALRNYFSQGHAKGSDVDVFFPNVEQFDKAKADLLLKGSKKTFENERITNFVHKGHKVQLVSTKYFRNPAETIANFDFTVCCCAVDKQNVYPHDTFFMDLAKKRLVINALPYPLSTMQRLQRYVQNGFTICNQGILTLAKAIKELDFEKPEDNQIEFYPDNRPRFVRWD
jgi:hypothetical protein